MRDAITQMLAKYECGSADDYVHALREILQEIALLGLWRSKFFEKAAFYGGTALRILYGLDRFSEDLDFSLVEPMADFELERYSSALVKELAAFGFEVTVEGKRKSVETAVQSAFLKADTARQLLVIQPERRLFARSLLVRLSESNWRSILTRQGRLVRRISISYSLFLSAYAPMFFRICSPGKCMPCFVGAGRIASRGETGTILCGIARTIRTCILRI